MAKQSPQQQYTIPPPTPLTKCVVTAPHLNNQARPPMYPLGPPALLGIGR